MRPIVGHDAALEDPDSRLLNEVVLIESAAEDGFALDVENCGAAARTFGGGPGGDVGDVVPDVGVRTSAMGTGEAVEGGPAGDVGRVNAQAHGPR